MRVSEIAELYDAACGSGGDIDIVGAAPPTALVPGSITLVTDGFELEAARVGAATAAFVTPDLAAAAPWLGGAVVCGDAAHRFLAFSRLAVARGELEDGVHPTAFVHPTARIGAGARIGALCTVGSEGQVAAFATLLEGAHVRRGASVGAGTVLRTGAVVGPGVVVGRSCDIGENAVVGSDHARYEMGDRHWERRVGEASLVVGDDVLIGPGTVIERGSKSGTAIASGAVIGGQVYIAHDVVVEGETLIIAQSGIASLTTIGRGAMLYARTGIADRLQIGERATVGAGSDVWKDVQPGARVLGWPARPWREALRLIAATSLKGRQEKKTIV